MKNNMFGISKEGFRRLAQNLDNEYSITVEVGDNEVATVGDNEVAIAGDGGTANAGVYGTAIVGEQGVATVGNGGKASAGDGGIAAAGRSGEITIRYFDKKRDKWDYKVGYIGEDGLKPNVMYKVDEDGEFIEA